MGAVMPRLLRALLFLPQRAREEGLVWQGPGLTFASCLVTKSTKPNPLCVPVPVIFFGKRTVFSSPKVLGTKSRNGGFRTEACQGGWGAGRTLTHSFLPARGQRCWQGHTCTRAHTPCQLPTGQHVLWE